ncbi:MAG: BatD family protein [Myxococcota bacterium]
MTSRLLASAWLAVMASAALARVAGAAPPCATRVSFDPERGWVGQQVVYRVSILSREDVGAVEWADPPLFPGFRVERLPGNPDAGRERSGGASYRVREERRALFAERAGRFRVGGARLRCRVAGEPEPFTVSVPGRFLQIAALPEAGRPADFTGLVGAVGIHASVEPRAVRLGESVRVAYMLRGAGNLWDAAEPLPAGDALAGAEVFRRRPTLVLNRGPRLGAQRHFVYDVVPRQEGSLAIPAVRLAYFDPATGRYASASSPPVEVQVGARRALEPQPGRPEPAEPRGGAAPPDTGAGHSGAGRWLALGGAILAAAALGAALRSRRASPAAKAALEAADVARAAGDRDAELTALAAALRAALETALPGARGSAAEELLARAAQPPARAAAQLLVELERARFDPTAPAADHRPAVESALAGLAGPRLGSVLGRDRTRTRA